MKTMKRSYLHTTLLVACLLPVAALHATTWIGVSGGDWFTPGNWDDGLPGDGKTAIINSGNVNLTNSTPQLAARDMADLAVITQQPVANRMIQRATPLRPEARAAAMARLSAALAAARCGSMRAEP